MRTNSLVIIIILLGAWACKQSPKTPEWQCEKYWYYLRGMHQEVYYLPLIVDRSSQGLIYNTPFDTSTYVIDQNEPSKTRYHSPYSSEKTFYFVCSDTLITKGSPIVIYQFSTADGGIDFVTEHYYTPEFGFFFIRSTAWPNYRILQFSDGKKSEMIWDLVHQLHPQIETSLRLAGVDKGYEHLRNSNYRLVEWNWRENSKSH